MIIIFRRQKKSKYLDFKEAKKKNVAAMQWRAMLT